MVKERITTGIKVLILILVLTLIVIAVPFFNIIALLIWPVPVVFVFLKYGMYFTIKLILFAALINSFLFGPFMGLVTIIGFGFIGFIIGSCLYDDLTPFKTLLYTTAVVLISQGLLVLIAIFILGFDLDFLLYEIELILEQTAELSEIRDILILQLQLLEQIIPALIIISSIITGIFQYYLTIWILNKKGFQFDSYRPVSYWFFPTWPVSLALLVSVLFSQHIFFLNLTIILFFLVFIQGFGVILNFISRFFESSLIKFIYFFSIFIFPVPAIIILLGLLDLWFNFRKI